MLEEKGGVKSKILDCSLIATTNCDRGARVKEKSFYDSLNRREESAMKSIALVRLGVFVLCLTIGLSLTVSAEASELKIGRVGTLIMSMDPDNTHTYFTMVPIKNAIFEGLTRYNPETDKLEPFLAERWAVADGGKKITFFLRKGIQFHGGYGELTAEDVKATIDRFFESEKWALINKNNWIPPLNRIEVVDKYTVSFHLDKTDYTLLVATFPFHMAWISSKKALEEFGVEGVKTKAIGTGPYELEELKPLERVVLKKFPKYWGPKPYYDKVQFVSFASFQAAAMALKAGEVDFTSVNPEDLALFKDDKNVETTAFPRPGYCFLGMNTRMKPFDDVRVRKAVRLAIDVEQVIQAKWGNLFGDVRKFRADSILPPKSYSGYWKDAPVYKPNLTEAKRLLKEAGYPDGFKTILAAPLDKGGEPEAAAVIQQQLKKIGIEVDIPPVELAQFYDEHIPKQEGKYPLFVSTWSMSLAPEENLVWFLCNDSWNYMKWCNPEYDRLWRSAAEVQDPQKRDQIYIDMQKVWDRDCISVWFDRPPVAFAWRKNIQPKFVSAGWEATALIRSK